MDVQELRDLLEVLRAYGAREYHNGDVHLVLGPIDAAQPAVTASPKIDASSNPNRPMYERVFRGSPPSFEKYKDIGLPVTEG